MSESSPVASRSHGRTGPSTASERRTGGSRSRSSSYASHASPDHSWVRGSSTPVEEALVGSIASSPLTRHATHEPGQANTAASPWASGSFPRSHEIFGAMCPGSTLQPVSSRSRSPSARASAASHSAPARRSHQISAGRSGSPSPAHATIPSSCEPKESAAISRPAVASRTCATVETSARVHSPGSCSAHPARGYESACGAYAVATSVPSGSSAWAQVPCEPTSTPTTSGASLSGPPPIPARAGPA